MSLQGKVVAITGGASGIGLATSKLLSSRGATVCIADIDPAVLQAADAHFTDLKVPFTTTKVDVSKVTEVDAWIDGIVSKFGKLDGAVNGAGIIGKAHGMTHITELEDAEWERIIGVNLTGTMYCLRAELRKISDGGSIVNISSIQGVIGFPGSAAYTASKHAVIGLTRATAKEVGKRNVRVNAVAPGAIQTPLLRLAQQQNPNEGDVGSIPSAIKRLGTAEELANVVAFLVGPDSSFVTGSVYGADGGWDC